MIFYKHYIGDYNRSTGDLSITEHGAYRLMLDYFYSTKRPLPSNKKTLYRVLRADSANDRKAINEVSYRFWRPLPEPCSDMDLSSLYDLLKFDGEEERAALRMVAQQWTDPGGLINVRALIEIVKAEIQAKTNRKIAIEREAKKRQQRGVE